MVSTAVWSSLAKAKSSLWFDELEIKFISNIGYSSKVNSFTTGSSDSEGNSCLASSIRSFTSCTASSFEYSTGNSRII